VLEFKKRKPGNKAAKLVLACNKCPPTGDLCRIFCSRVQFFVFQICYLVIPVNEI
jgi:hypothetical protein